MGFMGGLLSVIGNAGVQGFKAQQTNIDAAIEAKKEAALEKRRENLLKIEHKYRLNEIGQQNTLATNKETALAKIRHQNRLNEIGQQNILTTNRETALANTKADIRVKEPTEKLDKEISWWAKTLGIPPKDVAKMFWAQKAKNTTGSNKADSVNRVTRVSRELRQFIEDGDVSGANRYLDSLSKYANFEMGWRFVVVKDEKGDKHLKKVPLSQYMHLNNLDFGSNTSSKSSLTEYLNKLNELKGQNSNTPTENNQGSLLQTPPSKNWNINKSWSLGGNGGYTPIISNSPITFLPR